MTYFIQIILKIKLFCIKIAWFSHFTKTVTSKASKSLVFVFFLQKNSDFNTKEKKLASLRTNLDWTRQSTTLTLNSTKTCKRAGKSKNSVLETNYFYYKMYKKIYYVKKCFLRSLFFTILTILRLFSKISSPNAGYWCFWKLFKMQNAHGNPTLRAMHPIHKCVAKNAPHLLAVLRNEPRYS